MKYAKAIAVSLYAILSVLTVAMADDVLGVDETGTIIAVTIEQLLAILTVFGVRNRGYVYASEAPETPETRFTS